MPPKELLTEIIYSDPKISTVTLEVINLENGKLVAGVEIDRQEHLDHEKHVREKKP